MTANLLAANPTLIMPNSLFVGFAETLTFPILSLGVGAYHDLTIERSILIDGVNTPRALRSWTCNKRLTASQFTLLRDFWVSVAGSLRPFYFYPDPRQWDAGAAGTGRVTGVFSGGWSESRGPIMSDVPLSIREVA